MGHYDNCRPGYCFACGQAEGYCVHTVGRAIELGKKLVAADTNSPIKPVPLTVTIWKIRAADGTFSKGGSSISSGNYNFSKNGKTWHRASDLSLHLSQLDERSLAVYKQKGCKIVSYETVPTGDISIEEWIAATDKRREERNKSKEPREKQQRKMALQNLIATRLKDLEKDLEKLKKEFGE